MERIQKFLTVSDPKDGRIDGAFCMILDVIDLFENPIVTCCHDGKVDTVILLSRDAYAWDEKKLEAKNLQPPKFLTEIADTLLTGPCILPYDA
jgi:hypothetical protein